MENVCPIEPIQNGNLRRNKMGFFANLGFGFGREFGEDDGTASWVMV